MLFGLQIQPIYIVASGGLLGALLVFQILQGTRKIKFKGRTHMRVHKATAWSMLALGLVHGAMALSYFYPQLFL